jgi:hypothetical protein
MKKIMLMLIVMTTPLFGENNFDHPEFNIFYETFKETENYNKSLTNAIQHSKRHHPNDFSKRKEYVKRYMDLLEESWLESYLEYMIEKGLKEKEKTDQ